MAALKIDMTIPLGSAGHVTFTADIGDLDALTAQQRQVLADTAREFAEFGAATIAPPGAMIDPPRIHDPNGAVLAGVTGSRIRTGL
jgi:hypothetical protein